MQAKPRLITTLVLLVLWVGFCYGVRFYLMENTHWVEVCDGKTPIALCNVRSTIGVVIHLKVLAWLALIFTVPAFFVRGRSGRVLAWTGLVFTASALALYTVTLAVFALLIAALRLVRSERDSEYANAADTSDQPIA